MFLNDRGLASQILGGWALAGLVSARTGLPVNAAAFSLPAKGTWGNLLRYAARGPGNFEIDASLTRDFRLTERLGFNFRAAAFNLFNHPMYKNPSSSLGSFSGNKPSASLGKVTDILDTGATGMGAPRRIEFMMGLEF